MTQGDIAIYREATGLQLINTSDTQASWDTITREDGIYSLIGSNAVECGEAGHYFVAYNHPGQSASGTNRSEYQTNLEINGTPTPYGMSYGFIRRTESTNQDYASSSTILNVALDDQVSLHAIRTDNNSATVERMPAESGFQFIKLPDTFNYLRLRRSAAIATVATTPSTTAVQWDVQDEVDTGSFAHDTGVNPEDITLVEIGRYLVTVNAQFDTGTTGTRIGPQMILDLDGTTIAITSSYCRGTQNCNTSSTSISLIIETTSANQTLQILLEIDRGAASILADASSIAIMKLDDGAQYAIVSQTGAGQQADTDAAVTFDTTDDLTSDFSFTNGTSAITINTTDDYLCLGYFHSDRTGSDSSRVLPHFEWRVNNSEQVYGGFGAFNRGSQGGNDVFRIGRSGTFISTFSATDDISLFNTNDSTGTDVLALFEFYGLQVFRIDFTVDDNSSSSSSGDPSSSSSSSDQSTSSSSESISTPPSTSSSTSASSSSDSTQTTSSSSDSSVSSFSSSDSTQSTSSSSDSTQSTSSSSESISTPPSTSSSTSASSSSSSDSTPSESSSSSESSLSSDQSTSSTSDSSLTTSGSSLTTSSTSDSSLTTSSSSDQSTSSSSDSTQTTSSSSDQSSSSTSDSSLTTSSSSDQSTSSTSDSSLTTSNSSDSTSSSSDQSTSSTSDSSLTTSNSSNSTQSTSSSSDLSTSSTSDSSLTTSNSSGSTQTTSSSSDQSTSSSSDQSSSSTSDSSQSTSSSSDSTQTTSSSSDQSSSSTSDSSQSTSSSSDQSTSSTSSVSGAGGGGDDSDSSSSSSSSSTSEVIIFEVGSSSSSSEGASFIIDVKTDNTGTSNNDQFTIPLNTSSTYNFDWSTSDGQSGTHTLNTDLTITFPSAGTYTIKITGDFPYLRFNNGGDKLKLMDISNWGTIAWGSLERAYYGCSNATVTATDIPDLSAVSFMRFAFSNTTMNPDMANWDVSNISSWNNAFNGNAGVIPDVSNWNTPSFTAINSMWNGAALADPDMSGWDWTGITNAGNACRNSAFSSTNYNLLLLSLDAQVVKTGVAFHAGDACYNEGAVDDGTTDGTTANKLVDSTQNFLTTVTVNDIIFNTTDDTYAKVTAVDSDTQLSLDADIMVSGEDYTVQHADEAKARYDLISTNTWSITDAGPCDDISSSSSSGDPSSSSSLSSFDGCFVAVDGGIEITVDGVLIRIDCVLGSSSSTSSDGNNSSSTSSNSSSSLTTSSSDSTLSTSRSSISSSSSSSSVSSVSEDADIAFGFMF